MIRWEVRGAVGLAVIDRQERRNALNAELCDALREHLEREPRLRAVVVTGEGVAFCAGADLARRQADTAGGGLEHGGGDTFRPAFERLLDAIVAYPAPVIAAVNGPALGAGMQLAVACDLRVVAPGATFGIPAAKLGVLISPDNVARLVHLVGQGFAREVLLSGRTFDVGEADRVGLVHRHGEDARETALAWAEELAGLAPLTLQGHKRALNEIAEASALSDDVVRDLRALEAEAFASEDLQEGLAAFAERRPPQFRGR